MRKEGRGAGRADLDLVTQQPLFFQTRGVTSPGEERRGRRPGLVEIELSFAGLTARAQGGM